MALRKWAGVVVIVVAMALAFPIAGVHYRDQGKLPP